MGKPGDPSTTEELKDLDDHVKDLIAEAKKHGHTQAEIAEALERAASTLDASYDDEDDAA